jgi:hypothetical protein
MKFPLFSEVVLKVDIPEFGIKKGDVGTIVEYYPIYLEFDKDELNFLAEKVLQELRLGKQASSYKLGENSR